MTLPHLSLSPSPLLFWVLASVLTYALATNALWLADATARRRTTSPGVPGATRFPARLGPALCQAGSFLFYLGIPYLALGGWPRRPLQGLLSLEDMGLAGLGGAWQAARWLDAVGTGFALGMAALAILLVAWANANRPADGLRLRFPNRSWLAILVDVLYLEVHWAFYRGALALILGDVYLAISVGLGLVGAEWALNPFWRRGWRLAGRAAEQWLHAALALVIAFVFLATRNFWVCLGVHTLIELACWRIGREPRTGPGGAEPSLPDTGG